MENNKRTYEVEDRRLRFAQRRSFGGLKSLVLDACGDDTHDEVDGEETSADRCIDGAYKKVPVWQIVWSAITTSSRSTSRRAREEEVVGRPEVVPLDPVEAETVVDAGPQVRVVYPPPERRYRDHHRPISRRRVFGMGLVGRLTNRRLKRGTRRRLVEENHTDFRPFMTYWKTTADILIMVCMLCTYDFGPVSIGLQSESSLVFSEYLMFHQIEVFQPGNIWLGPSMQDLVRAGAKFTPCIRSDRAIERHIDVQSAWEANSTGCCLRNDGSGCLQTSRDKCSKTFSTFKKWSSAEPGPNGRTSGPVCGQDPAYCPAPGSHFWPDNLSGWPICHVRNVSAMSGRGLDWPMQSSGHILLHNRGAPAHVVCQVTARPCCIGIHGDCQLKSEQFCHLVKGTFHAQATLCSQVSCMADVCGLSTFSIRLPPPASDVVQSLKTHPLADRHRPWQVYRLVESLFLHAGLIHLAIVVIIQQTFVADLEKLIGSPNMIVLYFASGVVGNLASAVFAPYRAEVGPSGALFGCLGAVHVEMVRVWSLMERPWLSSFAMLSIMLLLFVGGALLPFVDNYAHLFGLITGATLAFAILPSGSVSRTRTCIRYALVSSIISFMALLLTAFLYLWPDLAEQCGSFCLWFTCWPLTEKWCAGHNINYQRRRRFYTGAIDDDLIF